MGGTQVQTELPGVLEFLCMNCIRCAIFLAVLVPQILAQQPPTPTPPVPASPYLRDAAITEAEGVLHISANSPRPLTQVLDALRQKYGWLVDYEDPRYVAKQDFVDRPGPNGTTLTLPSGGVFSVDVPAGKPATAPPLQDKTLQLIVDAYNQSKNPGRFELRKNEDGSFLILGTGAQDDSGKIVAQQPAFDQIISFPAKQRSATETVELICQKIADKNHVPMTLGITPRVVMDHNNVKVGGTKVQARLLLAHTLQSTGRTMYWRLLFDPNSKGFSLDLHGVQHKQN